MAVPTITFDQRKAIYPFSGMNFGMMWGTASITSYDTAHPAVTAITGKFRTGVRVYVSGVSSNGFAIGWDDTTKSFKAYNSNGASPAALAEAANAANIGTVQFLAMGQTG